MSKPLCRICKKRPPWRYKNCPPGICKRCYHKHVWPDRPSARKQRPDVANEHEDLTSASDVDPDAPLTDGGL
jgi:hypothetical protein